MNKRIREKVGKRRLAELKAQELGIDYENMNDEELLASIEESEKNIEKMKNNKSLVEESSSSVDEHKVLDGKNSMEQSKVEDVKLDQEEKVVPVEVKDSIVEGNSLNKEHVNLEVETEEKEKQKAALNDKVVIEVLDKSNSYNDDVMKKQLTDEAKEKEIQYFDDVQREDIRFETQNKYLNDALQSKSKSSKKESKIVVPNNVLKTVLNSKKPVLIRKNILNPSVKEENLNNEVNDRDDLVSSDIKNPSSNNIDVKKIVKSAIKEAVIELNKDKVNDNYQNDNNEELSGIKVVDEDGIKYVTINGVKVDKQENIIEALGIKDASEKEFAQATINQDDGLEETKIESTESSIRKELKKKNRKKKRKTIITWLIILILLFTFSYIYNFYNKNRRMPWTSQASIATNVETYTEVKVLSEETAPVVNINGVLDAYDLQNVVLRTDGAIKTINVKEGDTVKKGDVLVTVDDSSEQYNIANIESQIKSAKLTGNANDVKLLELRLANAKNSLEYTTAVANFDGVVAKQGWTVGDYNSLSTTTNNSMIIADLSKFKATVQIDELDIGYIFVGQKAELTFDSLPGVIVDAEVSKIPMLGRYSKQGFGVLDVEITIPNPPKKLKTGFTFSGKIVANSKESITVVNQAAVYPKGDKQYVKQKMADGSLKEIQVTVRYLGENKIQILSGDIHVGDTVVIENQPSLEDSMHINL